MDESRIARLAPERAPKQGQASPEELAARIEAEIARLRAKRPALSERIGRAERILVLHLSCPRNARSGCGSVKDAPARARRPRYPGSLPPTSCSPCALRSGTSMGLFTEDVLVLDAPADRVLRSGLPEASGGPISRSFMGCFRP